MNALYYGDNLDILPRYVADESVDLIYLDPPFNSNQTYNILFKEQDGSRSPAQIRAFEDTWTWDQSSAAAYEEVVEKGGAVARVLRAFRDFLGGNDMLAYLSMMAPRLAELRRVLKSTGSLYIHCDPTAGHYLKVLLDAIFGPTRFLNEIVWKRTHAHGSSRRYGPVHDILFFYSKSDDYLWVNPKTPHNPEYIEKHFKLIDTDGRQFQAISLTGSGVRYGESGKPWKGIDPTKVGRHWALPGALVASLDIEEVTVQARLDALDEAKLIYWPDKRDGTPRLKWYADRLTGVALSDIWTDIPPISAKAAERLGYPTQKPEGLLERILTASSREGDIVLDPFCGCGTAIAVAQRMNRRWIGIDITHHATNLIKWRLRDGMGIEPGRDYTVIGEPTDLPGARQLAVDDRFQFQSWALGLVGARTEQSARKGAGQGIDGYLRFHDEPTGGRTKTVIFSVKSGHVSSKDVRDLRGALERESAEIAALITLEEPTKPMINEAASAGFYEWLNSRFPRIQILTIYDLLNGSRLQYPSEQLNVTFRRAPRYRGKNAEQMRLPIARRTN